MKTIISVDNISKSFKNKKVLENISFDVKKGSVFGFFGPNGSGKTTTLRIILGLLTADSGECKIYSKNFDDLSFNERKKIGVVLENSGSYDSLTAYQNLKYFSEVYNLDNINKRIDHVLDLVDLTDAKNKQVGKFSTGMKKKLSLARALLSDPDILFLDEPTSGLDPLFQREFKDIIMYLSKKKKVTIFINTHNLLEAELICDHIAILHNKKLVVTGDLKQLLKKYKTKSLEKLFLKLVPSRVKEKFK